jgi:hypothetical protein
MGHNRGYNFVLGLITGLIVAALAAVQLARPVQQDCEPVVDVEYKRVGKDFIPDTVVRQPVRDAGRCVLAVAGA